eukprot:1706566-Pyramimonas_sp.AAC.2
MDIQDTAPLALLPAVRTKLHNWHRMPRCCSTSSALTVAAALGSCTMRQQGDGPPPIGAYFGRSARSLSRLLALEMIRF